MYFRVFLRILDGGIARLRVYGKVKPDWSLVSDSQVRLLVICYILSDTNNVSIPLMTET